MVTSIFIEFGSAFHSRKIVFLIEECEKKLALLDEALARGMADAAAFRVHDAEDVFAELHARYTRKP